MIEVPNSLLELQGIIISENIFLKFLRFHTYFEYQPL